MNGSGHTGSDEMRAATLAATGRFNARGVRRSAIRCRFTSRMLLYDSPVSGNCYKVRLLLSHLNLPFERRALDVVDRSNRPDVLGGLNPALRVPTLVLDDGRALAESGAILWYFGEGTRFVPVDRYERAQVLQWMFFEQYDHEPAIAVVRFWIAYSGRSEAFADRLEERMAAGYRALAAMELHIAGREFFVGGSPTLADIALYAYTHVAGEGGFELERYPAIRAWLDRVASMPGHVPIDA
jgi:glutathione S-transferase